MSANWFLYKNYIFVFSLFVYVSFFSSFFAYTAAIQALKRKKRFEKQLKQIDGTLSMIELQREALEGAKTNTATITTMKQASDAMKAVQKDLYVLVLVKSIPFRYV